jgi:long-chain acyl-CoA synthetase
LNKFYDAIQGSLKSQTGLKAKLIEKACRVKLENLYNGTKYTHSLYDTLVFKKIKQVLGGRVRLSVTASAPISPEVLAFLKIAFCCPILEAYGQTETCGAATATTVEDPDSGHVGGPIACCEIKLVDIPEMNYTSTTRDDKMNLTPCGEICFRGPNITPGYFKLPDKTAEVIDEEGWLHSGDVGMIRPDGSLRLIDRKKNIFKLAQGEYVAPEKIENIYVQSKYVTTCFVHGDSLQSYLIAIVVPEESHLRQLAKKYEVEGELKDWCQTTEIVKDVLADMTQIGKSSGLLSFEQAKKIYLHPEPFTVESGLLTPTFKIKRFDAKNYFSQVIEYLYSEPLATNQ